MKSPFFVYILIAEIVFRWCNGFFFKLFTNTLLIYRFRIQWRWSICTGTATRWALCSHCACTSIYSENNHYGNPWPQFWWCTHFFNLFYTYLPYVYLKTVHCAMCMLCIRNNCKIWWQKCKIWALCHRYFNGFDIWSLNAQCDSLWEKQIHNREWAK